MTHLKKLIPLQLILLTTFVSMSLVACSDDDEDSTPSTADPNTVTPPVTGPIDPTTVTTVTPPVTGPTPPVTGPTPPVTGPTPPVTDPTPPVTDPSEPTPSVPTPPTKVQAISESTSVLGQHNGFSEKYSGICVDRLLSNTGLGPRHALTFDDSATAFYWSIGENWVGFPTPWYPGLSQENVSACQVLDFDRTAANRICIEAWATAEGGCAGCSNTPQTESELGTVAKQCPKCPSSCVEANEDGCSATAVCNNCVSNGSLSKIYVFADDGDNVISNGKLVGDLNIDADSEGTIVCAEFGDSASGTDFEQVQQIAVCRGGCGGDSYNLAVDYVYLEVDAE